MFKNPLWPSTFHCFGMLWPSSEQLQNIVSAAHDQLFVQTMCLFVTGERPSCQGMCFKLLLLSTGYLKQGLRHYWFKHSLFPKKMD